MAVSIAEIEQAIADEAVAHVEAVASLNPYAEAEWIEIGNSKLVYTGVTSSVFGAYNFAVDEIWEEREWLELERFFSRKERAPNFWVNPLSNPACIERIQSTHKITKKQKVFALELKTREGFEEKLPDLEKWGILFSKLQNPEAREASFLALIKLHQKNTRFYENQMEGSYTFFHSGIALVPFPAPALSATQQASAEKFQCKIYCELDHSNLPLLYERILYEPI
jgi:hypothetical protein